MIEEIPEAVVQYWPRLREVFRAEILSLTEEERERTAEQPDFATLGIYSVACAKLLKRMDKVMGLALEIPTKNQERRLPKLTNKTSKETP